MFMESPCLADPDGRSLAAAMGCAVYCQVLGVRNDRARVYFVAMAQVFRCGDLAITALSDGVLKTSLDFVLGMERAASEELVGGTNGGALFIPVNNFLFQRDGATVLIDAGAGNTMQPTLGKLPANLKGAGIEPADVTHIVLTHMHPDHANGLVDEAGEAVYRTRKSWSMRRSSTSG
jgi:glyoxylase-like metal-dependent hydrolase (beta-lactamase superfamily II)